ncbi:MAG: 1-acyl-sn-glycerol-3-phosphate acyltransferase [Candidatus Izemoplasmatales bacterium]|nr:1-acyl-sn-glycerol-3-phosphate acyltransferase [Candidatus Izemoplasmatales bacterium]
MKRPNAILNITLGFLVKIFAFFKGQRIKRTTEVKGPAIVLSNHTSFFDFIYTAAALYPCRVSYMAASKMFYDPVLGFFLRLVRAFPKCLFQADPVSTMNVFRILRQKGIVSIFPEGQISPIGVTQPISFSIAKLLKKAKVDVYIVKHSGAYSVNPPWTKKTFPGRITTEVALMLSKERLLEMSEPQIFDVIVERLCFNISEYNEVHQRSYRLNDISNLESVLYLCPRCGFDSLTSDTRALHCPKCGNIMPYDRFGKVGGIRLDQLYRAQEQLMKKTMEADPDFVLQSPVKLESYRGKRLVEVGSGILTLNLKGYLFEGTIDNEPASLTFDPKNVPTLPSDLGRNVQIYEGYVIYQFVMPDVTMPTKFVIASEILHKQHISNHMDSEIAEV